MHIWVDADACPNVIKEILFRVAQKRELPLTLVANQHLPVPPSTFIKSIQVAAGFDVADNYIAQHAVAGDVVVTADIPLAADIVDKQAFGINPRGELYTEQNIRQKLGMRNFMEELRNTGQVSGGPPPLDHRDRQAFANTLDRLLTRALKAQA